MALRDFGHDAHGVGGFAADLAHHRAEHRKPDHSHGKGDERDHQQVGQQRLAHCGIDIVGVQAGAHHPVPSIDAHGVLQLGCERLLARAHEPGRDIRLAILAALQCVRNLFEQVVAIAVLELAGHVLAFPLGLDGVHHAAAVHGPDVEILGLAFRAAVARQAQGFLGGLLRVLYAHRALVGRFLVSGDDAVRRLHGGGQGFLAGVDDELALLQQRQGRHHDQREQRRSQHGKNLHLEAELGHGGLSPKFAKMASFVNIY